MIFDQRPDINFVINNLSKVEKWGLTNKIQRKDKDVNPVISKYLTHAGIEPTDDNIKYFKNKLHGRVIVKRSS